MWKQHVANKTLLHIYIYIYNIVCNLHVNFYKKKRGKDGQVSVRLFASI